MKERQHTTNGITVVYYGEGKGKTTAALGIALRAVGRGMNVKVLQFIKGDPIVNKKEGAVQWTTGEREFEKHFNNRHSELVSESTEKSKKTLKQVQGDRLGKLEIEALGTGFVSIEGDELPFEEHKQAADEALKTAQEVVASNDWQVVILDEIIRAIDEKLVDEKDVLDLMANKPEKLHLVLTGHTVSQAIIDAADLVTEMKKIKHPYDSGILAKVGIDY